MFIIKLMSGEKFKISEDSYKKLSGKQGLVFISEIGCTINLSSISAIYPERQTDNFEKRKEQKIGVLHDGTLAKRYFGEWVDYNNQMPDDNGNYSPVKLDQRYYPEIAMDCVATQAEFNEISSSKLNYYEFLGIKERVNRFSKQGEKLSVLEPINFNHLLK